jgi:hypothetical protein
MVGRIEAESEQLLIISLNYFIAKLAVLLPIIGIVIVAWDVRLFCSVMSMGGGGGEVGKDDESTMPLKVNVTTLLTAFVLAM